MSAPSLTTRETEVLQLIVGGNSNKEIAAALGVAADNDVLNAECGDGKLDGRPRAAVEMVRVGRARARSSFPRLPDSKAKGS